MLKEEIKKVNGLDVHVLSTPKYKTTQFMLQIKTNLSEETASERALLAQVLKSATTSHSSRKKIRLYLDDLYGASFSSEVQRKGDYHIITMKMETANEKFLQDSTPLFEKSLSFLRDVLEDPYLDENGQFSEKIIREEKRTLKQRIESIYDDKIRYANNRLVEEMFKGEPYSVHPYGDLERVERASAASLIKEYKRMLEEDDIRLYIVGDVNPSLVEKTAAVFSVTSKHTENQGAEHPANVKTKEMTETDDIQQGKLHMGYRTPISFADRRMPAMQVMNGLFGGFPHSKLFMNVREKESMAYYAASRYESLKGLIFVFAGIEASNYQKATNIIRKQLDDMKEGKFTEEAVEQTKRMVKNQLLETFDSARGLVELNYQGVIVGNQRNQEEWLEEINAVKKQDVVECAKTLEIDTVYFLRGEENVND